MRAYTGSVREVTICIILLQPRSLLKRLIDTYLDEYKLAFIILLSFSKKITFSLIL